MSMLTGLTSTGYSSAKPPTGTTSALQSWEVPVAIMTGGGSSAEAGLSAVLTADGREVYRGTLVDLAGGSSPFRLESGQRAEVVLQVSSTTGENPPGIVDLGIALTSEAVGGA